MTGSASTTWALLAAALVAAASPVLAGWTLAFAKGHSASWWAIIAPGRPARPSQ